MIVLLDNGHGGLINGEYTTPGKRKDWGADGIIYEGEFNRAIVAVTYCHQMLLAIGDDITKDLKVLISDVDQK